jgi:hypothetical protein
LPALGLFGQDFDIADGATKVFDKIGDFVAHCVFTLDLSISVLKGSITGKICGADIALQFEGSVASTGGGGRIRLKAVHGTGGTNTVRLQYSAHSILTLDNPQLSVNADQTIGLQILDPDGTAFEWLAALPGLPPSATVDQSTSATFLWLDVRSKAAMHAPVTTAQGPNIQWQDLFSAPLMPPTPVFIGPTQILDVQSVAFGGGTYEVLARPRNQVLHLHGDVLDTTTWRDDGSNRFQFQYALTNGRLLVKGPTDRSDPSAYWAEDPAAAHDRAVILLRLQNEHGHPIAFVPDATAELSIVYRDGVRGPVEDSTDRSDWDQTNAAMVIGPKLGAGDLALPGQLYSLDPIALYTRYSLPDAAQNSFDTPAFVVDGIVPLHSDGPLEIHGLSRGARLVRNGAGRAATLKVAGVAPSPTAHTFHKTELILANAADWTLTALREERDLHALSGAPVVGAHAFRGIAGQTVRLPVIDVAFAVSNLAGPDRKGPNGAMLATGVLPRVAQAHIDDLGTQFEGPQPTSFVVVDLDEQMHRSGARVEPTKKQAFSRVLDRIIAAAPMLSDTGRPGPDLLAQSAAAPSHAALVAPVAAAAPPPNGAQFHFGGELADDSNPVNDTLAVVTRKLVKNWRDHAQDSKVEALRKNIGIVPRPAAIDIDKAADLLSSAFAYIDTASDDDVSDITTDRSALLLYLENATAEDFTDAWNSADASLLPLFEHVWYPADGRLLRRILDYLPSIDGPTAQDVANLLFERPDFPVLTGLLNSLAAQLGVGVKQGIDQAWKDVVDLWSDAADPPDPLDPLTELRSVYGPVLTRDVYSRLLAPANWLDADTLMEAIRTDLGLDLRRLGDLATDPPEYLLRTQRFPVERAVQGEDVGLLWSQVFDLCTFPSSKYWAFFLDKDATVIVKLSQKRGLSDILKEVVAHYSAADRPDPLGLAQSLDDFIGTLDADLLDKEWTGAFFVRPIADLSQDTLLCDLVGFQHIDASWIAVGGRKPPPPANPAPGERLPALDIWARIFKQDVSESPPTLDPDPEPNRDVTLVLRKFDVRIRRTQLSAANIVIEINPHNVLGKQRPDFGTIVMTGMLQPAAKDSGAPPDLVFGAYFPDPFTIKIDLAFIDTIKLNALRVAQRNGVTGIEIDGTMTLKDVQEGPPLNITIAAGGSSLTMQGFRIALPKLPGVVVPLGTSRKLTFDLPSLHFAIPKPRAFNLFGLELVPTGGGLVRGKDQAARNSLKEGYFWLAGLDLPSLGDFDLGFVELDVDFGKLPSFGAVDARGLRFQMVLAFQMDSQGNKPVSAHLGISGLDAKSLKVDLFRILTLEVSELLISQAKLVKTGDDPSAAKANAGAIMAKDARLKILNWDVLKGAELDLLYLHPLQDSQPTNRKGLLAYYDAHGAGGGFFKVFWLLLAHNLVLPERVLNYLLDNNPGTDPGSVLPLLFDKDASAADHDLVLRDVALTQEESWLFGISFGLGEIFKYCNLILQDQHYYGIHLWASWVKAVFNQDSIELAYIPGNTSQQDRFRTNLRIPALDMLGSLKSGEFALEWGVNWDYLIDIGFPWRTSVGYDWFRSFAVPVGCYEAKFGFYIEQKTASSVADPGAQELTLSAGLGLYVGYYFGAGNSIAWVRAGIGVFAIIQGSMTFRFLQPPAGGVTPAILKASITRVEIVGIIGIMAYGEGGVDVWILSARFRVYAQVSVETRILMIAGGPCSLTYAAHMEAGYSASVSVGCGFCSWTFSVSGSVGMDVSGHLLLS